MDMFKSAKRAAEVAFHDETVFGDLALVANLEDLVSSLLDVAIASLGYFWFGLAGMTPASNPVAVHVAVTIACRVDLAGAAVHVARDGIRAPMGSPELLVASAASAHCTFRPDELRTVRFTARQILREYARH
jgi:hypothetical protein